MMRAPSFQAAGSQAGFVVVSLAKQRLWEPVNEDQPRPQGVVGWVATVTQIVELPKKAQEVGL